MKNQSNSKLPLVSYEAKTVLISFDEQEVQVEESIMYEYESVRMDKSITYSKVVSAIINDRYSNDAMQAVVNNYLKDPSDAERKQEFDEMQDWRDKAKSVARQIFPEAVDAEE